MLLFLSACASPSGSKSDGKPTGGAVSEVDKRQDEITIAMEQGKSVTYSIYQNALQRNETYRGRVVFEMVVLPSGAVDDVSVISSDIDDDAFLNQLIVYLKGLQFQPRTMGNFVTTIPLDFDQGM